VNFLKQTSCLCLALAGLSVTAGAADNPAPFCKEVSGRIVWTLLAVSPKADPPLAPFDPAGRVLGHSDGDIKGATTAIIKTATPPKPDGSTTTTDLDVWVTGPGDVFWGEAEATFFPIAGRAAIKDLQTIKIQGGTGRWAGVVGTLAIDGEGVFLNPQAGQVVGNLIFDVGYRGRMCKANFEDGWWQ
jgi:hypothetical protein